MDNLTHSLFALTLARTRLGRASPLATPALVVAANLPDLDVVVRPFGGPAAYLLYHRGITHAVIGVLVQIVLLTLFWGWLERRLFPTLAAPSAFAQGGPFLPIAVGLLTHPLLDLLNIYGLRPWLPFDDTWVYGDLVFVVDPWGWLLLGAIACLGGPRDRRGDIAWGLLAVAATLVVYGVGRARVPLGLLVAWLPAVGAIATLRARDTFAQHRVALLHVGAALGLLYLVGLGLLREHAGRVAQAEVGPRLHAGESIVRRTRSPQVADPFRWVVIFETERRVLWEVIDSFAGRQYGREEATGIHDPRVAAAAASDDGHAWTAFARHPTAQVVEQDGVEVVRLSDARYWFTDWCTIVVPVAPASR